MYDYFEKIRQWAGDRNLIEGSDEKSQFVKLIEEVGELAAGLARNNHDQITDSIGDAVVVLTIIAVQGGVDIEDCILQAWSEIKDRKGRMQDGVFIKQDDAAY